MSECYSLYKYYSPTEYNFDALEKGYWFFRRFGYTNDPFDCELKLLDFIPNKYGLKSADIKQESAYKFATCSFSNSAFNKHLWSLYCDNYSGFVVEFEYGVDDYNHILTKGNVAVPLFDVTYLEKENLNSEIPSLKLIPPIPKEMPSARKNEQEKENLFFYIYSIKEKKIWESEHEKRLLIGNFRPASNNDFFEDNPSNNGYKIRFRKQSVKRIIAGMKISNENMKRLKQIAKHYDISLEIIEKGVPFELKTKEADNYETED